MMDPFQEAVQKKISLERLDQCFCEVCSPILNIICQSVSCTCIIKLMWSSVLVSSIMLDLDRIVLIATPFNLGAGWRLLVKVAPRVY